VPLRTLPGAAAALVALAAAGVRQTVVSGNIRAVDELKLQVFGLDTPTLWELGAYGESHDVRAGLVRLSLQRTHTIADDAVLIGTLRPTSRVPTPTEHV
jgi:phosphoglycolate phosphatase-like HAD superfamily hydrolase